jgi:molecular chaperone GrpE
MNEKNKTADVVPTDETPAPAAPLQPGQVAINEKELNELKTRAAQADENWERFLRTAAEHENYRKRVAREKQELIRGSYERVVAALLPVLDNFERALAAAATHRDQAPCLPGLLDGLQQIDTQFRRALEQFGLEEVVARAGHPFDPNLHEAIGHEQSEQHPEGMILDQMQRGYKLADRLLRPARVVVSKGSAAPADAGADDDDAQKSAP